MTGETAAPTSHLDGYTSNIARLFLVARDIKISHTVFAMPFALLATFLAAAHDGGRWPTVVEVALIIVCMVLARTCAMAVNRWADAALDAKNPRTAGRAVPSGRLSRRYMLGVVLVCGIAFIGATGGFWLLRDNPWPIILSPAVLAWLGLYSFTKRFTSLCHLFLGSALAMSPVAATIAIQPAYLATPQPWLLAAMVTGWVAGFDVIYALQDVEADRKQGVFSLPARLGVDRALWGARGVHVVAIAALVALTVFSPVLEVAFTVGVVIVTGLLMLEHTLIWRSQTRHINMAFFTLNGVISLLLGGLGIADVFMHRTM